MNSLRKRKPWTFCSLELGGDSLIKVFRFCFWPARYLLFTRCLLASGSQRNYFLKPYKYINTCSLWKGQGLICQDDITSKMKDLDRFSAPGSTLHCVNWIMLCWSQGPFAQSTVSVRYEARAVCASVRLFLSALVSVALVQQIEFVHKWPISTVDKVEISPKMKTI